MYGCRCSCFYAYSSNRTNAVNMHASNGPGIETIKDALNNSEKLATTPCSTLVKGELGDSREALRLLRDSAIFLFPVTYGVQILNPGINSQDSGNPGAGMPNGWPGDGACVLA
eukprot:885655-Amorphochlora_amoeboformis.AAC.1